MTKKIIDQTSAKLVSESSSVKFQDFNPNLRVDGSLHLVEYLYQLSDYYQDYDEDDSKDQEFFEGVKECLLKFEKLLDQGQN